MTWILVQLPGEASGGRCSVHFRWPVPRARRTYLLDRAVQTSLNLGFNSSVVQALDAGYCTI